MSVHASYHWDEETVKSGIGGSETYIFEVSKRLSLAGYDVTLYADPEFDHDPYENFHLVSYKRYYYDVLHREYDYFIFFREVSVNTVLPYLKCHNVFAILSDTQILAPLSKLYQIGLGRIKKYCYLSEYHKMNLLDIYEHIGLTEDLLYKISNGYSTEFYENVDLHSKTNSMIWSSSLCRGFYEFYNYVFVKVREKIPDFILYVCTEATNSEVNDQLNEISKHDGVVVLNRLSKEELANYQKQSKIWVYPGTFPETFCITASENVNAGNVVICPLSYGLYTTLENVNYLKEWDLNILTEDNAYTYIEKIVEILNNDDLRIKLASENLNSCDFSWDKSTKEIIDLFENDKMTERQLNQYVNKVSY